MNLSTGSTVFDANGCSYRLVREVGRGGQGSVWTIDGHSDQVAKFYHNGLTDTDAAKISAMCRLRTEALSSVAAWPISLLKPSKSGTPAGLLMRKIADYESVHQLYGLKSRLRTFPHAQLPFLIHVATNTARAFATIHAAGQVIGDVNHSNLMVGPNGTVAMIDCDSFQITDGAQIFRCPVGVPEFTPPELQGKDFRNTTRTAQHDAFGLSILIFYLLFLGRHPFMGLYDVKSDDIVSLDQAIGLYKFPYALGSGSSEVRLPAFVPRLADYPSELANLFIRTFTRDALTRGRPSATEWLGILSNLPKVLKTCKTNPNHQFFSGISDCPWCRAEGALGTPIFGIKVAVVGDRGFNLVAVWVEIEKVKPVPEPLQKPELDNVTAKYSPDPTIPEIARKRRVHRLGAIGIILAVSVLSVAASLVPLAAISAIAIALIIAGQVWKQGNIGAKPFIEQYDSVLNIYREAETEFDRSSAPPARYAEIRTQLDLCKREYEGLAPEKAKRLAKLNAEREAKQRQRFLEKFRIEDATIPNIGPKNKLILRTWGIEDAWDVDEGRIQAIKGFGPVKINSLMEWRRSNERLFRFDPKQSVDPRDLNALEQEFAQKARNLERVIMQGVPNLSQAISVWHAQRRQQLSKLSVLAEKFAEANVNRRALGRL